MENQEERCLGIRALAPEIEKVFKHVFHGFCPVRGKLWFFLTGYMQQLQVKKAAEPMVQAAFRPFKRLNNYFLPRVVR